jgi:hypothetical protein
VNWKNVLLLISIETKSNRLVGGKRFRRFRENKAMKYALYFGASLLGSVIGWLFGNFYSGIQDIQTKNLFVQEMTIFFTSLPTIALLYGLVFTQIGQIRRIRMNISVQPLYWFPITWGEHTLASIAANILGVPLAITACVSFGIVVASIYMGLVPLTLFATFSLLLSVLIASATTEITRISQVRTSGAITKAAGRAAIWLRLIGSMVFFVVFYAIYFSLYSSTNPFLLLEIVAKGQSLLWFVPYVWPAIALSYFANSQILEALVFSVTSIAFTYALFLAATKLNTRYGLYEIPAIRISSGAYVPRPGLLRKLGFSPSEAAVMRKDFKAFTRRLELSYVFLFPILFTIMPIFSAMGTGGQGAPQPYLLNTFLFVYLTLMPGTITAMTLGTMMISLEGESIWYIYSSPINARSLVRGKYFFTLFYSLAVTLACSLIGGIFWTPSQLMTAIVYFFEAIFLIFPLSMVSFSYGIKGADFREYPRRRMVRPKWSLINGLVCIILALIIISPIIPYTLNLFFEVSQVPITISLPVPEAYPFIALSISGVIACTVAYIFYHKAVRGAEQFLIKAKEPT